MDKMKFETPDMTQMNIDKIAALFPNCITEKRDAKGKITKAVNFEALKQMLGDSIANGDESYEFTWVGKRDAMIEAAKPIRKTLRPYVNESVNFDTTENLYIEGDNLEALKLLQEGYLGKVKMIYIDPPYNTGNDFIYKDDFRMDAKRYAEESGDVDDEGNRMVQNSDSNGRFHSDWCSMIYSRLLLARNLLTDDGAIFISIDDNEVENLRKICDDVFGEENFISQIIWQKSKKGDAKFISVSHEYVLIFVKSQNYLLSKDIKWRRPKQGLDEIFGQYEKLRNIYGSDHAEIQKQMKAWFNSLPVNHPALSSRHYTFSDDRGLYFADNFAGPNDGRTNRPRYDIIHPVTGLPCKKPATGWRWDEAHTKAALAENPPLIHFGPTHETIPCRKSYLKDVDSEAFPSVFYKDGRSASLEVASLLGKDIFDFPKDEEILRDFIKLVQVNDGDLVLDFFSGSATTAHAVMKQNAEDGLHRRFILVQIPEACEESSKAYKAGYKNICEIGKERIRRAGAKILAEKQAELQKSAEKNDLFNGNTELAKNGTTLDIGFRVLKIDDSNMKDVYYSAGEVSQQDLIDQISNVKEDRNDMDLLFGCLVDWGIPLSLPIKTETIDGVTIHNVNDGALIASFSENIPETVIRQIAAKKPLRVVFRDSSFRDAPSKINVTEIFKTISPNTTVKVI